MSHSEDVWCGRIRLAALAHAYWDKGASLVQLAKAAGVTDRAISRAFKRHEIPTRGNPERTGSPGKNTVTAEQIRKGARMGLGQRELAKRLGISHGTVSKLAKRYGVRWPRRPTKRAPVTREKLVSGARRGFYQYEVAEQLGVSPATVSKYVKRYGIDWELEQENGLYLEEAA